MDALDALPEGARVDLGGLARRLGAPEEVVRRCARAAGALERLDQGPSPALRRLGDWELLEELARGGQGAVHRARHVTRGEEAALKLMSGLGAPQRARLAREVRALTRLRHAHLVRVLDAGETGGVAWLAMELVPGESLQARLRRGGPLPVSEAVELVRQAGEAVAHAHAQGVLHRDLKPGNVLLRPDGRAVVTDFGLARELDRSGSESALSVSGRFLGTPGYCAPEQARGELTRMGPACDVYGLGALLVGLLTGRPPDGPGQGPASRRPEVDPALDAICRRALAPEPEQRQADAAHLVAELARWQSRAAAGGPAGGRVTALALGLAGLAAALAWVLVRSAGDAGARGAAQPQLPAAVSTTPAPAAPSPGAPPAEEAAPVSAPAREEAARLLARAKALSRSGAFGEAQQALDRAVELAPSAEVLSVRGTLRYSNGDPQGGLLDLDRALELDPDLSTAWRARGTLRRHQGDAAGALSDLDRAIALAPDDAAALNERASLHLQLGDATRSVADYRRAADLLPPSSAAGQRLSALIRELSPSAAAPGQLTAAALVVRAEQRRRRGDAAGALEDYTSALEREPQLAEAWLGRGELRMHQGELRGAATDLERALELDPDRLEVVLAHGALRELQQDLVGALADYERAVALAPRAPEAYHARAQLRAAQGDLHGARADLDRALALDPRAGSSRGLRAQLRAQTGDLIGALRDYRQALVDLTSSGAADLAGVRAHLLERIAELAADPRVVAGERELLLSQAEERRAAGDLTRAREALDELLALAPEHGLGRCERARVRLAEGDREGARADLAAAQGIEPADAALRRARASLLAALGDVPAALEELAQAVALDPGAIEAHVLEGALRTDRGELAQARAALDRAVALDPGHGSARARRARVRALQGDLPGALADRRVALVLTPIDAADRPLVEAQVRELERRVLGDDPPAATRLAAARTALRVHELARCAGTLDALLADAALDPDLQARVHLARALLHEARGERLASERALSLALSRLLDPRERSLAEGLLALCRDDPGAALEPLARTPQEPEAALFLAQVSKSQLSDAPGAYQALCAALAQAPDYARALVSRAELLEERGNLPAARADLDRALEIAPQVAGVWGVRARVRHALGDDAGALADLERAVELIAPGASEEAELRRLLAAARAASGR